MPLHLNPPPPCPEEFHLFIRFGTRCYLLYAAAGVYLHSFLTRISLLTIRNLINYAMHICYTYIRLYLPALGQILYDKHKYVAQL